MMVSISLDQVRETNEYDFSKLFGLGETNKEENIDSPFQNCSLTCD